MRALVIIFIGIACSTVWAVSCAIMGDAVGIPRDVLLAVQVYGYLAISVAAIVFVVRGDKNG